MPSYDADVILGVVQGYAEVDCFDGGASDAGVLSEGDTLFAVGELASGWVQFHIHDIAGLEGQARLLLVVASHRVRVDAVAMKKHVDSLARLH